MSIFKKRGLRLIYSGTIRIIKWQESMGEPHRQILEQKVYLQITYVQLRSQHRFYIQIQTPTPGQRRHDIRETKSRHDRRTRQKSGSPRSANWKNAQNLRHETRKRHKFISFRIRCCSR